MCDTERMAEGASTQADRAPEGLASSSPDGVALGLLQQLQTIMRGLGWVSGEDFRGLSQKFDAVQKELRDCKIELRRTAKDLYEARKERDAAYLKIGEGFYAQTGEQDRQEWVAQERAKLAQRESVSVTEQEAARDQADLVKTSVLMLDVRTRNLQEASLNQGNLIAALEEKLRLHTHEVYKFREWTGYPKEMPAAWAHNKGLDTVAGISWPPDEIK